MVDSMGKINHTPQYYNANQSAQFYKYEDKPGAHMATNNVLLELKDGCDANCVKDTVNLGLKNEGDLLSNWETGNRDTSRLATRMNGETYTDIINMMLLTLPGTAFTYYGEEIGMVDVSAADAGDQQHRDQYRTPLQWSDEENAGFTEGSPWLPVANDYATRNIKVTSAILAFIIG